MKVPAISRIRNYKTWLVLGVALGIGVLAAVVAQSYLASRMAEIEARAHGQTIGVVVAKRALRRGDRISEDTVAIRDVPIDYAHSQAILPETFERAAGQVLSFPVEPGEMVLWSLLEGKKAPTFSSRVAEGRRAITVPVDEINSISGLLEPGDLVDLVLTVDLRGKKQSFLMMQRVLVLATGQRALDDTASGEQRRYSTVTLDTTPDEARSIIRARDAGKLTALLRNPKDGVDLALGEQAARFLEDWTAEPAEVPVLYGGRSEKILPEALRLGQYVSPGAAPPLVPPSLAGATPPLPADRAAQPPVLAGARIH